MRQSKVQNLKSGMDMGGRINACRRRLRRSRAMQRAGACDAGEREAMASPSLMPGALVVAETISSDAQSPVALTANGPVSEVDRRPQSCARLSTEEEIVRA